MPNEKVDFEKTIAELEGIVTNLEKGDMPLDDMLVNFEKGINLARQCAKVLDNAEKKISVLTKKPSGEVEEKPFKAEE